MLNNILKQFLFACIFIIAKKIIYRIAHMKNSNYNSSTEYEKAIRFLDIGCNCGCSKVIPREKFAKLRETFQALSGFEQGIFLMAQLKAINGGK